MKIKNLVVYSEDQSYLKRLAEEYKMIGFDIKYEEGRLTVFCLKQKRGTGREVREANKNGRTGRSPVRSSNKVLATGR